MADGAGGGAEDGAGSGSKYGEWRQQGRNTLLPFLVAQASELWGRNRLCVRQPKEERNPKTTSIIMNRMGAYHRGYDERGGRGGGRQNKRAVMESKNKIIPSSARGDRLREELLSKIVPWEEITDSLHNFPYYLDEHTKSLLMECMASHLKHSKVRKYRGSLNSSSERIMLQSVPGMGLYRERLVSALARELQVPLLKLGCDQGYYVKEDNNDDDSHVGEDDFSDDEFDEGHTTLKKGDRVQYIGETISFKEVNNRTLSCGQRGEVSEVIDERVAVVFNICGLQTTKGEENEKNTETFRQALVTWLDASDVVQDDDVQTHDFNIAMEVLYGVLESQQPVIVYFPDSFVWPDSRSHWHHDDFPTEVKQIYNRFPEGVVMICAQNSWDAMKTYANSLKTCIEILKVPKEYRRHYMIHNLFTNVICIKPPTDEDLLSAFIKQIEEDWLTVISKRNLRAVHKVLKDHNLSCMNLEHPKVKYILTKQEIEKIVGLATNHYLSSCPLPCVKEEILHIPYESIKLVILRLKGEEEEDDDDDDDDDGDGDEEEEEETDSASDFEDLATYRHKEILLSALVRSEEIGVKFDDVGGLEHVKKVLHETVILPMRRPELFSHGNLLRPCKGILLFGPPGAGKTFLTKALATELGANLINVPTATLTSLWHEEYEKFTRALFSYARKLAPAILFMDEVDSLLRAHGGKEENTASLLYYFMAAWDGLKTKKSQQILVIGATNRPFDVHEAAICRMTRRIYVGLPDIENRSKILEVLLKNENLESGFSFQQLAEATEDYSGSDLKNLCVAAAYRRIEELLEKQSKDEAFDAVPAAAPRPLNLDDFIHTKTKLRASLADNASSIIKLKGWNEQYGMGESQR